MGLMSRLSPLKLAKPDIRTGEIYPVLCPPSNIIKCHVVALAFLTYVPDAGVYRTKALKRQASSTVTSPVIFQLRGPNLGFWLMLLFQWTQS